MKLKNDRVQQIAKGFVKYLEKVGQVDQLPELSKIQQKQGWLKGLENTALITSSVELKPAEKKRVVELIKKNFDLSPKIKYKVDKSIIGGLIIRVGNKVLDVSLKHRLEKLRESMLYA
jgi:F-type H+-transporting ATPase subunit delta